MFDDLVTPLELYRERGFGTDRILGTVTAVAAGVLDVDDETGRIRERLHADLLVVPGDPPDDLQRLRAPRLVMARGRVVQQATA